MNSVESGENYIIDIYNKLNVNVTEPLPYGEFHLAAICIILFLTVAIAYFLRNAKPGVIRGVLIFFWLLMVGFELVSQFVRSSSLVDGTLVFKYRWHSFPFQLCATGLWVLPLAILMPEGRMRDAVMTYMGLYSLFGGFLVCITGTTVFGEHLISNVHTMVQHGSQVVVGVLMLVYNRKKLVLGNFLRATGLFLILESIAILVNAVGHHLILAYGGNPEGFNMFYISPYYNSEMPIIGYVFDRVPWGVLVFLYTVIFILISFTIYFISVLSTHAVESIKLSRAEKRARRARASEVLGSD